MPTLILYTTLGCHLCEQAKSLIWPVITDRGYQLQEVDIADSEALMARYGTAIPVLENPRTDQQLFWPFAVSTIEQFLEVP